MSMWYLDDIYFQFFALCLCICSTVPAQIWLVHLSWNLRAVVQFLHMLMCCRHCGGWLVCIYIGYWNCLCVEQRSTHFYSVYFVMCTPHGPICHVEQVQRHTQADNMGPRANYMFTSVLSICSPACMQPCIFTIIATYLSSLASLTMYSQGRSIDCVSSPCETWRCPCLCTL